jgi:hypothetical protein
MKAFIILFTLFCFSVCPSILLAQDSEKEPEESVQIVDIDGFPHLCFTVESAKKLLDRYEKFPTLELKIKTLEELIGVKADHILALEKVHEIDHERIEALIATNTGLQKALEKGDAWYYSPWLWCTIGLLVGTGVTIGISYAVK